MRKNYIIKNSFRAIGKSFSRFLSLVIMSLLGVFVFAGLQATPKDMMKTLDNHLDTANVYDIKIISSMGLVEDDIEYLKTQDGILNVEGSHSIDVLIEGDEEYVVNISSLPDKINQLSLLEGNLPNSENEIVVEENLLTQHNLSIGDTIFIHTDNLKESEFKIVGTINSALYFNSVDINQTRGTTSVGTGTIQYYAYVQKDSFQEDYYSAIYITVKGSLEETTASLAYQDKIDSVMSFLESIKEEREEARYQSIYKAAKEEIDLEEALAQEELNKVEKELQDAKTSLNRASEKLDASKKQLTLYSNQLNKMESSLKEAILEYQSILAQYQIEENEIENTITILYDSIEVLNEKIRELTEEMNDQKEEIDNDLEETEELEKEEETEELEGMEKRESLLLQYQLQVEILQEELTLLLEVKKTKEMIADYQIAYQKGLADYQNKQKIYEESVLQYQKKVSLYEENYQSYVLEKQAIEKSIRLAKEQLELIEHPVWYLYDRNDYSTYSDYIEDSNSIQNLSKLFPVIFFAVAIFVSLISMNRMVEDDRLEIGTLKSLGFSNRHIMIKYGIFSFMATLLGGIIGGILGVMIIPSLIFNIYGLLFTIPNFQLSFNLPVTILGVVLSAVCICGATILTVFKVLKENTADLMRAKAPKQGKRVFLESQKWLWNRLTFSKKVTIRNLFRYKKRAFVTILGIAGCTALMLCGFGIKDSIVDIATMQYVETYQFDAMAYTKDLSSEEKETLLNDEKILSYEEVELISGYVEDISVTMYVVQDDSELSNFVHLVDKETQEVPALQDNQVIITDKLADLLNIHLEDMITIVDTNHQSYTYQVSAIVKNYIGHSIYVKKDTYEKDGNIYQANVLYLHTGELESEEKELLSSQLLESESVIQVMFITSFIDSVTDMLGSLDKVVVILIVLAAMLSFVVLYNLSNINIQERKREIATLKVLGFYHQEVDNYITKENVILTLLGIGLGLVLGYFLTNRVITTVEIERARFIHHIRTNSYLYASFISLLFTIVVNFITHFSLKKIDMIESLKSVE